ncbi:MAG: hypothetical protein WCS37_12330 [Chloroflexota bacterium]
MSQIEEKFEEIEALCERGQLAEVVPLLDKLVKDVEKNPSFVFQASAYNKLGFTYIDLYENKVKGITVGHCSRCFQKALDYGNLALDSSEMAKSLFGLGWAALERGADATNPQEIFEQGKTCIQYMKLCLKFSTSETRVIAEGARKSLETSEKISLQISQDPSESRQAQEDARKTLKVLQEPAQDPTEFSLQLSRERSAKKEKEVEKAEKKKGWLSRLFGG